MVEFPIQRSVEHQEKAAENKCSCTGCVLSAGITKFSAWKASCKTRGAHTPSESRFADRFSVAELYLTRGNSPVKPKECTALAETLFVSPETAQELLEAAKAAGESGVQIHEGHPYAMRRLGQRYSNVLLSATGVRLGFRCVPNAEKKSREPMLCLDTWDDWFPAAGTSAAAVVDNDVVAQWNESVPPTEMEAFCASCASTRGPTVRTWTFHHSAKLFSLVPHRGSVPVYYIMTRPTVLLPHD